MQLLVKSSIKYCLHQSHGYCKQNVHVLHSNKQSVWYEYNSILNGNIYVSFIDIKQYLPLYYRMHTSLKRASYARAYRPCKPYNVGGKGLISCLFNSSVGFLRHNLQISQEHIKENDYKTLITPNAEYASSEWDPYTQENQQKLVMIKRRGARYVKND